MIEEKKENNDLSSPTGGQGAKSIEYRKNILKYIYHANAGHTGGSLSCIDILNVLYNGVMNV